MNNLSHLINIAYDDMEGAKSLAKASGLFAQFIEALPPELSTKLNPNIK